VILSDRTIREELEAGRIVIEPLGEGCIQPSSVDLHVDRFFRVFRNHTMGYIDVKQDLEDLTELVEIGEEDVFILHPGEFVLGSTLERVALPNDLVARLEGKSSLGRLGLLIHSSLPAGEPVLLRVDGELAPRPIDEIVRKQLRGEVVAFDPVTLEVGYHEITGWYEGPPDRIFEVRLRSGRRVRVTGGHNLFTLDRDGRIEKVRTLELRAGSRVAIPRVVPEPSTDATPVLRLARLVPESTYESFVVAGPTVNAAFGTPGIATMLRDAGYRHTDYYRGRAALPFAVAAQIPGLLDALGRDDGVRSRGGRRSVPAVVDVTPDVAWLLGIYVAEGYRRDGQFVISSTDERTLDRAEQTLAALGQPVYRVDGSAVTCSSTVLSAALGWLGTGGKAADKRVPPVVFGWPDALVRSFFDGLMDGDGSRGVEGDSYWTCSSGLVGDVLLLATRLGLRAGSCFRERPGTQGLHQVMLPHNEHKLLTAVPLPDQLLTGIRHQLGWTQREAADRAGFQNPTDVCNIEKRTNRDAVRRRTLQRLRDAYRPAAGSDAFDRLDRLVDGGLLWDEVVEIVDTGVDASIFDIEVRPGGRHIENFVAGSGGVFVSNTAGFVDAGWDGHLTLELSNVANLPITLYPGMKIGQISFLQMTTEADQPYGTGALGSKYRGQRGPTPSRYFENFRR
jgi:deoxycytidine triphosphate deaminase/intein/homing endonuclease